MAEETETLISKHSSGVSIIIRINGLWIDANSFSCSGKFSKWNTKLDVIWRELARDIQPDEYDEIKKEFDSFDEKLIETGPFTDGGSGSFDNLPKASHESRSKQYRILNDKELFLKRLENKLGKGTTFSDGDEDDF
ncbi:hypothetical protein BMS3Abin17_00055 [archaeon BMS3Abin17]|nr:hypothetical protein BMS3Abin17_00055 [archaeon BMS3Abin17]